MLFPDNYELSGNSDYKCLSGDKAQQKLNKSSQLIRYLANLNLWSIIGFNTKGNPMEVFYNIIDNDTIKIFHAMALRDKVKAQMDT